MPRTDFIKSRKKRDGSAFTNLRAVKVVIYHFRDEAFLNYMN